jgi:hypothetical protein
MSSFLVAVLVLLIVPADAWAWGPITHLTHGSEVLGNLTILGVALQRLLTRHRLEYLYGCVGADITQAKKYTRAQQAHCHSWGVGWSLLERARSDRQRAFAYGYLTHLAGDVYSHNHYIPTQLIVSYPARALRHVYWEARFDNHQQNNVRDVIRELRRNRFDECDDLVETVVARTIFSFRMDKQIFNSFIAVHDLDQWHQIMGRLVRGSKFALPTQVISQYNQACSAAVQDVLLNGKDAGCQTADPTGLEALNLAKRVRRSLKALDRKGRITPKLKKHIDAIDRNRQLGRIHAPALYATLET